MTPPSRPVDSSASKDAVSPLCHTQNWNRRDVLVTGGVVLGGAAVWGILGLRGRRREPVFLAKQQRYDGPLVATIRDGLTAVGLTRDTCRGRRVLLKPNLVEPCRDRPHMTTHPAVVVAAAEVFAGWDAHVVIGEVPGHVRDTELAPWESGLAEALRTSGWKFADLNYEPVRWFANRGRVSPLRGLHLPRSVVEADLLVSLPKLKTHHWVGMTASMKNLYGVLPGIKYGWPKNVLHHAGIPQTVVDINATVPRTLAIVDAIECMEGDGPILGTPKAMGLLAVGACLPALDATLARVMGLNPSRILYLHLAAGRLGPIADHLIEQRGEPWRRVADPFAILEAPHLEGLRA